MLEKLWQLFARSLICLLAVICIIYGIDSLFGLEAPKIPPTNTFYFLRNKIQGLLALLGGFFFLCVATGARVPETWKIERLATQRALLFALYILLVITFIPQLSICNTSWCIAGIIFQSAFAICFITVVFASAYTFIDRDSDFAEKLMIWSGWIFVGMLTVVCVAKIYVVIVQLTE